MLPIELPPSPIAGLRTIEFGHGDEPRLQRFFDANPFYFIALNGEPAWPDEANDEIHGEVPSTHPSTTKRVIGFLDAGGEVVALASVISDLTAPGAGRLASEHLNRRHRAPRQR